MLIGSTLYAVFPGMDFAVVTAHETEADLAETQAALESWFVPILVVGAVTFAFSTVLFAVAVARAASFARLPTIIRRRRPGGVRAFPGRLGCRYPLTYAA